MPRPSNEYPSMVPSLFTAVTQAALHRAIARAIVGPKGSAVPLRRVIAVAMAELTARRMDPTVGFRHLDAMVETAGRGGAGDRMSLMSGQPRWKAIRDQVLAYAHASVVAPSTS